MADILWKSSQDSSQSSPNTTTSGRSSTRISIPDLDIDSQPEIMKNQPETLDRPITPPLVCSNSPIPNQEVIDVDADVTKSCALSADAPDFVYKQQNASDARAEMCPPTGPSQPMAQHRNSRHHRQPVPNQVNNFAVQMQPAMVSVGGSAMQFYGYQQQIGNHVNAMANARGYGSVFNGYQPPMHGHGYYGQIRQQQPLPVDPRPELCTTASVDAYCQTLYRKIKKLEDENIELVGKLRGNEKQGGRPVAKLEGDIEVSFPGPGDNYRQLISGFLDLIADQYSKTCRGKHETVILDLNAKLVGMKAKLGVMKSEITHLNACAEKKNASMKNKNAEINQMRLAMKAMTEKAGYEARIEEVTADYTAQILGLQGTMSKLQEDLLREQGEKQAKVAALKKLEEENERHAARLTKLEPYFDKFITLEREKETLIATIARLERRTQGAEAKKSEMSTLCGKLTNTIKQLEKQLERSKSRQPPKPSKQPKKTVQFSDPIEIPASTKSLQSSIETVDEKTSRLAINEHSFLVFVCIMLSVLVVILLFWKC